VNERNRVVKDAFFFYKAQWNCEPMVYITARGSVNLPTRLQENSSKQ
jgi:hypothetical protein